MKERIAIMTDSTSDIPREILDEYDIKVVPLRIIYSDGEYRDQVDITSEGVYRRLPEEVPSTSLPAPGDVLQLFEQIKRGGVHPCLGDPLIFRPERNRSAHCQLS